MIEKLTFGLFTQEDSRSFMRLMAYIRPYKVRIIFALIAIFGVAATESYLAAFIAPLVNQGFAPPSAPPELNTAGGIVATLQNWKDQFTYLIWGTPNKVWVVPVFFIFLNQQDDFGWIDIVIFTKGYRYRFAGRINGINA